MLRWHNPFCDGSPTNARVRPLQPGHLRSVLGASRKTSRYMERCPLFPLGKPYRLARSINHMRWDSIQICTYRESNHALGPYLLQNLLQRDCVDNVRFTQGKNLVACLEPIASFLENPCSNVSCVQTCSTISQLERDLPEAVMTTQTHGNLATAATVSPWWAL